MTLLAPPFGFPALPRLPVPGSLLPVRVRIVPWNLMSISAAGRRRFRRGPRLRQSPAATSIANPPAIHHGQGITAKIAAVSWGRAASQGPTGATMGAGALHVQAGRTGDRSSVRVGPKYISSQIASSLNDSTRLFPDHRSTVISPTKRR